MSNAQLLWHGYRYFPYERMLAEREAAAFFGRVTEAEDDFITVPLKGKNESSLSRLTYFKVAQASDANIVPDQTKLEASAGTNGSMWFPVKQPIPELKRQSTRYSAHGLHEYRGKFNPQVVRAIGNIFGLKPGSWVLDPFCGSGTTLLESAHIGWNCVGFDINPLGVLIANAKVAAFKADPNDLQQESEQIIGRIQGQACDGRDWKRYLPNIEYLQSWFPKAVLVQIRQITEAIDAISCESHRNIYKVILSDICRDVSLQDPKDLRIRRRKEPKDTYPALELFVESIRSKIATIRRAREFVSPSDNTKQIAIESDCRVAGDTVHKILGEGRRRTFDAAITSPPYATALPYMDTQRLSLAVLGLMEASEIRRREKDLIGNREITDAERRLMEAELVENTKELPDSAHRFCVELLDLADHSSHGFRRKNVPSLVYAYLGEMATMFETVRSQVKRGGKYALLVGRNTTTLQKKEITIQTPTLLAEVAESRGWTLEEMLSFDAYHRYDVHRSNSITAEELVVLKR